jgi:hypothetical protein
MTKPELEIYTGSEISDEIQVTEKQYVFSTDKEQKERIAEKNKLFCNAEWISKESVDAREKWYEDNYNKRIEIVSKAINQSLKRILDYYVEDKLLREKAEDEFFIILSKSIERQEKEVGLEISS